MAAVIGALRADLSASVAKFEADMGKAAKAVQSFGRQAQRVSQNLEQSGQRMTMALTAPFLALAVTSARAAAESRDAIAQVESRLESMGGASGKATEELQATAKQLQGLSTFDDDDILRNVTNAMLTFGNIAGENFDRAQRAAVDMATSLQMELQPAALMIGKALNDPTKGITKLTRAGVTFTAAQKDQIKALQASGDLLGAQAIMLAELEREFKGAGEAARSAIPGADAIDAWREFQETVGATFLRIIDAIEPFVVKVLDAFASLSPGMQDFIVITGLVVAAIGPLLWAIGAFVGAVGNLAPLWASFMTLFSNAMVAAGIADVGLAIKAMTAFLAPWAVAIGVVVASLWEFRGVLVEAFQAVMAVVQGNVLPAFQKLFAEIGSLFGELSTGPIAEFVRLIMWMVAEVAGLFLKLAGILAGRFLATVVDVIATAIGVVVDLVQVVESLLSGDFAGAWANAVDLVTDAIDGILGALENLIPGITAAARAAYEAVQRWIADGIAGALSWIEARFPGLVAAMAAAAQGAVAWARNLFTGIKTWINDNLGPVIQWAKDRIRELNSLFGWITRRQAAVSGGGAAEPAAPAPPARPPARPPGGAPEAPAGGGGGGGRSATDKAAEDLRKATDKFREAIADTNDAIDTAFDRRALPRSMQQAEALRDRLEDAATTAREAGVDMQAFAAGMATAQQRIRELEIEGLAIEARAFADDVRDLADDIVDFGGGLPPLEDRLREVDRQFADLRAEIVQQIEANRVLADSNADAAAAMGVLERQLGLLDAAHQKATTSARALSAAEERLRDVQAASEAADTQKAIRDLERRRGQGGPQTGGQQEMQAAQDDLDAQRQASARDLAALQVELEQAQAAGDAAQVARLEEQIALQTRLHDLVTSTTADQILHAERVQSAWDSFEQSATDGFAQLVTDWKGGLDSLKRSFATLVADLLKAQAAKGISAIFSKFAGGFATGGTLGAGQWGIAGENGPEPIFSGARSMTVVPNDQARSDGGFYIDARGAGPREVDELRRMFENMDANFDRRVVSASNQGIMRKKIRPPSFG